MKLNQELMDNYLDGELTPAQQEQLAVCLRANKENVREFICQTWDHHQIHQALVGHEYARQALRDAADEPALLRICRQLALVFPRLFRWPAAVCATMAVAVGCVYWLFGATVGQPSLAEFHGTGVAIERAGQIVAAQNGEALRPGDVLRSRGQSGAKISFAPERTTISLSSNGQLKIDSLLHGKQLTLRAGTMEAAVARQRAFRPLLVDTLQAEARVIGTKFTLSVTTNATRLEVRQGRVRLTRLSDHASVQVGAGQYAVASGNDELNAQPLTGRILREYWTNLIGEYFVTILTANPNFPDQPSGRDYLDKLETPSNWARNYGARIRGYVHPATTGAYTFWLAASDGAELFLGSDENPGTRRQIAYAKSTKPREWTKSQSQQSADFPLVAGRKYYIEVLQKQGNANDYLAVAWQGPGRDREVIPGESLSPFHPEKKEKSK